MQHASSPTSKRDADASSDRVIEVLIGIGITLAVGVLVWWLIPRHPGFFLNVIPHGPFVDLDEHLRDAGMVLRGANPYVLRPILNDTAPPLFALLVVPLYALGHQGAALVMTELSLLCVMGASAICIRWLRPIALSRAILLGGIGAVPLAVLLSAPLRSDLFYGQERTILLLLVLADLVVVRPSRRGWLIALAGAIALTPLAFVLILGLTTGARAVARCACGFIGFSLIGALAGWGAWFHYWFVMLPSGEQERRVLGCVHCPPSAHPIADAGESSLRSVLARPPFESIPAPGAIWFICSVVLAVIAVACVVVLLRRSLVLTSIFLVAITATAIGPVSHYHYWVWGLLGPFAAVESWADSRGIALATLLVPIAGLPPVASILADLGDWPGSQSTASCVAAILTVLVIGGVLLSQAWSSPRGSHRLGASSGRRGTQLPRGSQ